MLDEPVFSDDSDEVAIACILHVARHGISDGASSSRLLPRQCSHVDTRGPIGAPREMVLRDSAAPAALARPLSGHLGYELRDRVVHTGFDIRSRTSMHRRDQDRDKDLPTRCPVHGERSSRLQRILCPRTFGHPRFLGAPPPIGPCILLTQHKAAQECSECDGGVWQTLRPYKA